MAHRPRHPNKHIEAAVAYAESLGWRVEKSSGRAHCWGTLYCPRHDRDGCKVAVYSTPRVPENHARQLRSAVELCHH